MSIDRQQAFSGTKESRRRCASMPRGWRLICAAQCTDFAGPLTVKQFKGGQSNPTYLLETPARRYVLRRKPPGKLLPSAHAVDREYRVIRALHAQGFPGGRAAALLRRRERRRHAVLCDGFRRRPRVLGAADARLESGRARRGLRRDERDLARLHSFDPAKIGLVRFRPGENYVARQVDRWSKQYRASETEKIDAMERLIEWLPQHIPPSGPGAAGAWRLPARQSDPRRRTRRKSSRCSIGNCPRSAIRSPISPII